MAVANGCVEECDANIRNILDEKIIPQSFLDIVANCFFPVKANDGINWTSLPKRRGLPKTDQDEKLGDSVETGTKKDVGLNSILRFSPNVLCLFLQKTLFPRISLCAPSVNQRSLRLKRVWFKEDLMPSLADSDQADTENLPSKNPGMIATLLDLVGVEMDYDPTFAVLHYFFFPYKAMETNKEQSKTDAETGSMCEYIFAHDKADASPSLAAYHVTSKDLEDLIRLLFEVSLFYMFSNDILDICTLTTIPIVWDATQKEDDGDFCRIQGANTVFLLEKLSVGFTSIYNNLKEERDWRKLYQKLVVKCGWCQKTDSKRLQSILRDVFKGELENAVGLLLHGLSPVRMVFGEGQSRMASLYYYQRKIVPTRGIAPMPLSRATSSVRGTWSLEQHWTLARTGDFAECFCVPNNDETSTPLTHEYLAELKAKSQKYMDLMTRTHHAVKSITLNNLADCVDGLIESCLSGNVATEPSNLVESLKQSFMLVLSHVCSSEHDLQKHLLGSKYKELTATNEAAEFVQRLFASIYKNRSDSKPFPSLLSASGIGGGVPELAILMFVLGTALVDADSIKYLKCCMNKEWIVPIVAEEQIHNHSIDKLHPGTYINELKENANFNSKYYAVS